MQISTLLADHVRAVYHGENWTAANLRDKLSDVTWRQATTVMDGYPHSIATLIFHMNYFVRAATSVLRGGDLDAKDKFSFDAPRIQSQEDWNEFMSTVWQEASDFAQLVEAMPESQLWELMADEKYGDFYRNIQGIIEHNYYHLGQIAILKTLIPA